MKRALRWTRNAVLALLVVAALGAGYERVREILDRRAYPAPGQLVDVGGYRLHIHCTGSGSPTVVMMPGAGEASSVWGWIAPDVARNARVCVYDRAGRGWSDDAPEPQDGIALARDLHTLLERAGEAGPFVLVGHSFGGLYVRTYASLYDADVAGMVLLDASSSDMFTKLPTYPAFYNGFKRVSVVFPALARLGVGRVIYGYPSLPAQAAAQQLAFWSTARHARSQRAEWIAAPTAMEQARALRTLGSRPLIVLTAGVEAQDGWMPLQQDLAALSSNADHRVLPGVSHMSMVVDERGASLAAQAIRDVLAAVRTSQPLRTP